MCASRTVRALSAACLGATGLAAVASTALTQSSGDSHGARIDAFAAYLARVDATLTADVLVLLLRVSTARAA
ncbi:hypothetical protein [Streptomyces sp. T028]|uniref:hypothetical protein n=1 Tax=Streptomyces sp. T028 TaxID=3394379 RepID=UPI003A8A53EB